MNDVPQIWQAGVWVPGPWTGVAPEESLVCLAKAIARRSRMEKGAPRLLSALRSHHAHFYARDLDDDGVHLSVFFRVDIGAAALSDRAIKEKLRICVADGVRLARSVDEFDREIERLRQVAAADLRKEGCDHETVD
jgi:hypothetical protein